MYVYVYLYVYVYQLIKFLKGRGHVLLTFVVLVLLVLYRPIFVYMQVISKILKLVSSSTKH